MTRAKKLKKAIRSRAGKTGESYTSARRQVLEARRRRATRTTPEAPLAAPAPPPARRRPPAPTATRGSRPRSVTSDSAVLKKTGHGFDHWFSVLDAFGARAKGHTASARHLSEAHGVPDWHCQMITVEYERAHGLRATNQSCDGDFQVSVSRTIAGTVSQVAHVLGDARRRAQWLRGADPQLARALEAAFSGAKPRALTLKRDDYARMRFPWDASTVEIHITGKPNGSTTVAAGNMNLKQQALVETRRAQLKVALDALKAHLTE